MRVTARVLLALISLFATARVGLAKCDPSVDPDRTDVANARAAVAAACDCNAATHGAYVKCAGETAKTALVNKSCVAAVRRCAARSTCGKPGFVTCCRTSRSGKMSCAIKRDAGGCVAPRGGSACVGSFASCCDACGAGGCAGTTTTTTTTTSTSTSTTTTVPTPCGPQPGGTCGGACDFLMVCEQDPQTGDCHCGLGPCRALGGIGHCGGSCPAGATCSLYPRGCGCIVACGAASGPACTFGACLPPQQCGFNAATSQCECGP